MLRLQLLAIEADEEGAHIVEELVYPREVYKTLVDGLDISISYHASGLDALQCDKPNVGCLGVMVRRPTTKISPRSFAAVHFNVYPSFRYEGFEPASSDWGCMRSSMKTSRIKLLMTFAPTGT